MDYFWHGFYWLLGNFVAFVLVMVVVVAVVIAGTIAVGVAQGLRDRYGR